jgi:hypothetical protein
MTKPLKNLQKLLEENYRQYKLGEITKKEYLIKVKHIDREIAKLEMTILHQYFPVSGISSLQHLD